MSSVREEECVTRQAYPSHRCVPQDTTVLQGPLLLDSVLQSVLYLCVVWCCDCPSSCLSLFFSFVLSCSPTCRLCLLVLHWCFIIALTLIPMYIITVVKFDHLIIQGSYSDQPGGDTAQHCRPCEAGWFCSRAGLSAPQGLCNPGHYCTSGASTASPVR